MHKLQCDQNKMEPNIVLLLFCIQETKPQYNGSLGYDKTMFRQFPVFYSVTKLKTNISHLLTLDFKNFPTQTWVPFYSGHLYIASSYTKGVMNGDNVMAYFMV
jgi:hypothetical protein